MIVAFFQFPKILALLFLSGDGEETPRTMLICNLSSSFYRRDLIIYRLSVKWKTLKTKNTCFIAYRVELTCIGVNIIILGKMFKEYQNQLFSLFTVEQQRTGHCWTCMFVNG